MIETSETTCDYTVRWLDTQEWNARITEDADPRMSSATYLKRLDLGLLTTMRRIARRGRRSEERPPRSGHPLSSAEQHDRKAEIQVLNAL